MKKFVVLEQGCQANWPIAQKHKKQFSTDFCDSFRLNWKGNRKDRYADFFATQISWSEGRSLLFEQTRENYEYYIFIDDDIDIVSNTRRNVAEQLRVSLDRFRPIHGSLPSSTSWPKIAGKHDREAIRMLGGDLCVQIFSRNYAELMFPAWWCGSGCSMWHAQFLAHRLAPDRSLFLNHLKAVNTRHGGHFDDDLDQFTTQKKIRNAFESALRFDNDKKLFRRWRRARGRRKLACSQGEPSEPKQVTWSDIERVVDLEKLPMNVSKKRFRHSQNK